MHVKTSSASSSVYTVSIRTTFPFRFSDSHRVAMSAYSKRINAAFFTFILHHSIRKYDGFGSYKSILKISRNCSACFGGGIMAFFGFVIICFSAIWQHGRSASARLDHMRLITEELSVIRDCAWTDAEENVLK